MLKTIDEIDSYIRLKYGYPLTTDSYDKMPNELVEEIYLIMNQQTSTTMSYNGLRRFINSTFTIHEMVSLQLDNEYCSEKVWEVIKEYHRDE